MSGTEERRNTQSNVRYEPDAGVLTVGERTAVVADVHDPDSVMHVYFDLVAEQRVAPPTVRHHVRDRDVVALASIIQVPEGELESYIDRELARFLNEESGLLAGDDNYDDAELSAGGSLARAGRPRRRYLYVTTAVSAVAVATAAFVFMSHDPGTSSSTQTPTAAETQGQGTGSVRVVTAPDGGKVIITESPAVPVAADGTDIGGALSIERQP